MKIAEIIIEDAVETDNTNNPVVIRMKENLHELAVYAIRHCQPYLAAVGGLENALFNIPLYRGFRREDLSTLNVAHQEPFITINIRKDRIPIDTPKDISTTIDNWFEKNTGIRFREQSLFCSGRLSLASCYGEVVVIVPLANFDCCWSGKFEDMYVGMSEYADAESGHNIEDYHLMTSKEKLRAIFSDSNNVTYFMENADYQFNAGLLEGIESGHEIMIVGNRAIAINYDWLKEVKYHYDNEGWTL